MKDRWWKMKALELKHLLKSSKGDFSSLKTILGLRHKIANTVDSRDKSQLLTDHDDVLKQCGEHFTEVLNSICQGADLTYINLGQPSII